MRRVPVILLPLIACVTWCVAPASGQPTPAVAAIDIADLHQLRSIESVSVSPDGAWVACSVHQPLGDAPGATGLVRRLWLVDLLHQDREAVPLTSGVRDDRQPVFAPDSRRVAFYRVNDQGLHQAHVIPADGGEPIALGQLPSGIDAGSPPAWSPDGSTLLVTGWVEPDAEPGPLVERIGDAPMFVDPRSPRRGLWILDASGVDREPVGGPLFGFPDCGDGVFARDGRTIYCTVVLQEEPEPGLPRRTAIGRIGVSDKVPVMSADKAAAGATSYRISVNNQIIAIEDSEFDLFQPRLSDSGDALAFLGRSRRATFFEPVRLGLCELTQSSSLSPNWLTGPSGFDRGIEAFQWRAGQDSLLLTALDDGGIDLLTITRTLLSQPRVIVSHEDDLPIGITSFSSGGGVVAMARSAVDAPSELWVLDGRGERLVWNPNQWVRSRVLSIPQAGWVTPRGEDPIPYWLYLPPDVGTDDELSIITWVGAGPGSMLGPGIETDWFSTQLLAGRGFAVLQVNPRGTAGYGRTVLRRAYRDFVRGPSRDVMAVLQQVRQQDQRLGRGGQGLMATSVGAMVGSWMLVADQDFDVAIFEDGVYNITTHLAEHPNWPDMIDLLGGLPQDPGVLSTMRDIDLAAHVDRIKTPVMLMTGSTGETPTVLDTQLMYRMLSLGFKDVQLVSYPDGPSGWQQRDRYERILSFLGRHLSAP
ncbi:MAG: prolyl oligopeptidase family serine peptidase [Phycisphaerales bacterium]|nr:prolyl oligopeptidase family serine peptidase [Phycisphaerales bacterium]